MTAIHIAIAGDAPTYAEKCHAAERITSECALVETGNDNELVRSGFMIAFAQLNAENLFLGGKPTASEGPPNRAALVTIRVMAGPWENAMKSELVGRIDQALRETLGLADGPVWVTFLEVPDGGWGVNGQPITIDRIAPLFEETRRERIQAYLEG